MTKLVIPTEQDVKNQFKKLQIPNTSPVVPRNGFYHIIRFEYRNLQNRTDVPMIIANWKASREDLFLEEVQFEIAVSSLQYLGGTQIPADLGNSIGKNIQVFGVSLSKEIINNKEKAIVTGKWIYEVGEHKFYKPVMFLDIVKNLKNSRSISELSIGHNYVEEWDEPDFLDYPEEDFSNDFEE